MKRALKWIAVVLAALIVVMVVYSLFGLQKTLGLTINEVDLAEIADGTYTGTYDSYRWTTTVEVTVKDHAITAIAPLKAQDGRENLIAELTQSILAQQRTDVDAVSGATASSKCFLKAVETALDGAAPGTRE